MTQAFQDRYVTIFDAAANGSGAWFKVRDLIEASSTAVTFIFKGTWNSGTITIEMAANAAALNAIDSSTTFTANGYATLELSKDMYIRATLSGSGGGAIVGTAQ